MTNNLILITALSVGGLLCIGNAIGEGGFKVLFDFSKKYGGGKKIDIIIFIILGISCLSIAILKNKTIDPDFFCVLLCIAYIFTYFFCWNYSRKNNNY